MIEKILSAALGQGLYAAMFVALLFWVLRKNEERERSFQQLLGKQAALLQEISGSLKLLDEKISRMESLSERSVYHGKKGDRCLPLAGEHSVEPGQAGWGGVCHYPGGGRADARPEL